MQFKIGLCQMKGSLAEDINENKRESWEKAERMIRRAREEGCQMAALPEMWNTPYDNKYFEAYAEDESGISVQRMSALAKELSIYIIGGSISERDGSSIYNTSFVFDRQGNIIGKHRKAHLFDVDIEGGIRFMESDTLTAGDSCTVIDTEYGKIGLAICFDVRFPELFMRMSLEGAKVIFLPAAFNTNTGPAHWDLLMRARAVDNQVYLAAVSPARSMESSYHAYGSSCIVNPWAEFTAKAGSEEELVTGVIDLEYVDSIRRQLPVISARKPALYYRHSDDI